MKTTKVTLSKGGTAEKTVRIDRLEIPDLWHTYIALKRMAEKEVGAFTARQAEQVLRCWHIAHDLKRHIVNGGE